MTKYLMVGIPGFLGLILRFWVGAYVSDRLGGMRFPYWTFIINCTGSFLVGLAITVLTEKGHWNPNWRGLVSIGFIGGYTTFSTFEYETFRNFMDGEFLVAGSNVAGSVLIGFCFSVAGRDYREDDLVKYGGAKRQVYRVTRTDLSNTSKCLRLAT